MATRRREVSWSDLPAELLPEIAIRLSSSICAFRFRAVCKSWRSSCPLPIHAQKYDVFIVASSNELSEVSFGQSKVYIIEPRITPINFQRSSSHPSLWLAIFDVNDTGKFYCHNPLSTFSSHRPYPPKVNLLNFRVREIAEYYFCPNIGHTNSLFTNKILFCSDPNNDGLILVKLELLSGEWYLYRKDVSGNYRPFYNSSVDRILFVDAVIYNGKLYAIDGTGQVYRASFMSSNLVKFSLVSSKIEIYDYKRKRLLESNGYLYSIVKPRCGGVGYKVYKLDENTSSWLPVDSLGDQVFVVTADHSFSLSTLEFPTLPRDCIFAFQSSFGLVGDNCFEEYEEMPPLCIFNLAENKGCSVKLTQNNIFWPPPTWLNV